VITFLQAARIGSDLRTFAVAVCDVARFSTLWDGEVLSEKECDENQRRGVVKGACSEGMKKRKTRNEKR